MCKMIALQFSIKCLSSSYFKSGWVIISSCNMADAFCSSNVAELYSIYRPVYPPTVLETIVAYCKYHGASFEFALDVGCGSGQSTKGLLTYYDKVLGVDRSASQIAMAPKDIPNMSFKRGSAEDLYFVDNESVDLITAASASHWFDTDLFYSEMWRLLKPDGVFAEYNYFSIHLTLENPEANKLVHEVSICVIATFVF